MSERANSQPWLRCTKSLLVKSRHTFSIHIIAFRAFKKRPSRFALFLESKKGLFVIRTTMLVSPRPLFNETPTPCPVLWLVVKPYLYGYVGKGFYLPLTGTSNSISSPTFLPVPRPQASEVGFSNVLLHPTLSHYSPSCLATRY